MANETAPFDRIRFEQWRGAHPDNAKAFDETARTWGVDLPVEATRFAAPLDRPDLAAQPGQYARLRIPALALAASLVVGLLAFGMANLRSLDGGNKGIIRLASPLTTGIWQTRRFRLSDGSVATLGPNSELRMAFTSDRRSLALTRGAARFDVAHAPQRPFAVAAGSNLITARGTSFAVDMSSRDVRIALYRGSIDVEQMTAGRHMGKARTLAPGDVLILPMVSPPSALMGTASLRGEIIAFNETRVSDAVAAFEARTGAKFVIAPRVRGETITGGFDANDAAGFATMLATMFHLVLTEGPRGELVLSAP